MRPSITVLCLSMLLGSTALAQGPARGNFIQRWTGLFQPKAVKQALREAKSKPTLAEHDAHLTKFVKENAATLPLFSVRKLAKATHDYGAHEKILTTAGDAHKGEMSFAAVKDLARGSTTTYEMQNRVASRLLKQNTMKLTLRQQARVNRWAHEVAPPPSESPTVTSGVMINPTNGHVVQTTSFGGVTFANDLTGGTSSTYAGFNPNP